MSQDWPAKCTGTTILGSRPLRCRDFKLLGERRDAHIVGPRIDVDEVDAGAAIQRAIGRCHEGIRRRPEQSPGPRSSARQAMCSAAVALATATALRLPQ